MNIEAFGVKNRKGVAKETILAGIGAGILLCIVYSATAYIGVLCSSKRRKCGKWNADSDLCSSRMFWHLWKSIDWYYIFHSMF